MSGKKLRSGAERKLKLESKGTSLTACLSMLRDYMLNTSDVQLLVELKSEIEERPLLWRWWAEGERR